MASSQPLYELVVLHEALLGHAADAIERVSFYPHPLVSIRGTKPSGSLVHAPLEEPTRGPAARSLRAARGGRRIGGIVVVVAFLGGEPEPERAPAVLGIHRVAQLLRVPVRKGGVRVEEDYDVAAASLHPSRELRGASPLR